MSKVLDFKYPSEDIDGVVLTISIQFWDSFAIFSDGAKKSHTVIKDI